MGYIQGLRKKVGNQTIIMPCACLIIYDQKGRVLLQHRTDNGLWSYHGGAIEIDESAEDAVRREVKEELGLSINDLAFFKIYSGPLMHYTYPNGDEVSSIDILYTAKKLSGDLVLQKEEIDGVRWFAKEEMPDNMTDQNKKVFTDFFQSFFENKVLNSHKSA